MSGGYGYGGYGSGAHSYGGGYGATPPSPPAGYRPSGLSAYSSTYGSSPYGGSTSPYGSPYYGQTTSTSPYAAGGVSSYVAAAAGGVGTGAYSSPAKSPPASPHTAMRMDIGRLRYEYGDQAAAGQSSPIMASPLASPSARPSPSPLPSSLGHAPSSATATAAVAGGGQSAYNAASYLGGGLVHLEDSPGSPPPSPLRSSRPSPTIGGAGYQSLSPTPLSPKQRSSLQLGHGAKSQVPSSSISPTLARTGGRPMDNSALLDDLQFLEWLFLNLGAREEDPGRLGMLKQMLEGTSECEAVNVVLTNGFAVDASKALRNVGLATHFATVCDTRGGAVRNPQSEMATREDLTVAGANPMMGGRYSKTSFITSCVFNEAEAQRLFGVPKVDHVVYVDDDPELFEPPRHDVRTIRLPKEGSGLTADIAHTVVATTKEAHRVKGQVLVVFDFDCTLSGRHMFKSMYQPMSHWATSWDQYAQSHDGAVAAERKGEGLDEKDHLKLNPNALDKNI